MIKITKNIIEEMYSSSHNQEVVGSTYDLVANSIPMQTELENGVELKITVYSHFIRLDYLKDMIREGENDIGKIFHTISFIDEEFTIYCNDEYTLTDEAKEYLLELHKEFSEETKSYDLEMIESKIEEYQAQTE